MSDRPKLLTVRMSDEEMAMLKRLAESEGMSASDLIRQFVRHSHAKRFDQATTAKPKRKR